MVKRLWILWFQGFEHAPYVVKNCLRSWQVHNKDDWEIIQLDNYNIQQFISSETIQQCSNKKITRTAMSDIVRIELLRTHGGLWVDSTTFCRKPLDCWLRDHTKSGFFAYELQCDRQLCSWFLYGDKANYTIEKWYEATMDFLKSHDIIGTEQVHVSIDEWNRGDNHIHYYWFHYLFGDLVTKDEKFKHQWNIVKKLDGMKPHMVQHLGMSNPITHDHKEALSRNESSVFKLSYKYDGEVKDKSVLSYLFGDFD